MNILLVAMSLDIGGAETHVVSLAKELKNKGHNPVVISSGGVYVNELRDQNIKHYCAPLNKKGIMSISESIRTLRKAIKKEHIDIIHAHGRIPALIGKLSSILFKVPFMTTAHAKFDHKSIYKYFSFWGDEVICISDDIKDHLVKNFGVRESRISLIKNGIDTEKFIPMAPNSDLTTQLKLSDSSKKVVYISRLSESLAELAKLVVNIGLDLNSNKEEVEFIIVGDGEELENIMSISDKINEQIGKKVIYVLGKRTDITNIVSLADIVICVSRTALEAMACEKPVILAGGEGYMGLLTEENLEEAILNNFTGRTTSREITKEILKKDILNILDDEKQEERNRLGRLGRKIITDNFSIKSMTDETVVVYERLYKGRNNK